MFDPEIVNHRLFFLLQKISPEVEKMHFIEFMYCMEHVDMTCFSSLKAMSKKQIEEKISEDVFFKSVQLKPEAKGKIVIDKRIQELRSHLFLGLFTDRYDVEWVKNNFYFDVRSFVFYPSTKYISSEVRESFKNYSQFTFPEPEESFDACESIGLNAFLSSNKEIDEKLKEVAMGFFEKSSFPIIIGLAGPTAAGKTEFAEQLNKMFVAHKKTITTIEMDNFFVDRAYREKNDLSSHDKESFHYPMLVEALKALKEKKNAEIPSYEFIDGVSSHAPDGKLVKGKSTINVEAADVIYIDGNTPFLFDDLAELIDLKICYITDDNIRLKRKWRRDIDYRKKYKVNYFINRYFRTQFLKAKQCYIPQLLKCDVAAFTTKNTLYVSNRLN